MSGSCLPPENRGDCDYCAERLRVNVGLLAENVELKRKLASSNHEASRARGREGDES